MEWFGFDAGKFDRGEEGGSRTTDVTEIMFLYVYCIVSASMTNMFFGNSVIASTSWVAVANFGSLFLCFLRDWLVLSHLSSMPLQWKTLSQIILDK